MTAQYSTGHIYHGQLWTTTGVVGTAEAERPEPAVAGLRAAAREAKRDGSTPGSIKKATREAMEHAKDPFADVLVATSTGRVSFSFSWGA